MSTNTHVIHCLLGVCLFYTNGIMWPQSKAKPNVQSQKEYTMFCKEKMTMVAPKVASIILQVCQHITCYMWFIPRN